MKLHVVVGLDHLPEGYFDLRYAILRKPLGSPLGSERIEGDDEAVHAWIEDEGRVVCVGRAHLLANDEDGSAMDEKAQSACPAFDPLSTGYEIVLDDVGVPIPSRLRPAFQVRQMATDPEYQGKRLASKVLAALEEKCQELWGVRSGWLQARIGAIKFYRNNGWTCFGAQYNVPNVGPHRSLWKKY
jgi:GNAT superfamily N-acetyltransferase